MSTSDIKSKYAVMQELEKTDLGLAFVYSELCDYAKETTRQLADLSRRVADNEAKWANQEHLFWEKATASNATDFERAHAQYKATERIFLTSCYAKGYATKDAVAMVISARNAQ